MTMTVLELIAELQSLAASGKGHLPVCIMGYCEGEPDGPVPIKSAEIEQATTSDPEHVRIR